MTRPLRQEPLADDTGVPPLAEVIPIASAIKQREGQVLRQALRSGSFEVDLFAIDSPLDGLALRRALAAFTSGLPWHAMAAGVFASRALAGDATPREPDVEGVRAELHDVRARLEALEDVVYGSEDKPRDRLDEWRMANADAIAKLIEGHVAVSPTRGVVANAATVDEFARQLEELDPEIRRDVIRTHTRLLR